MIGHSDVLTDEQKQLVSDSLVGTVVGQTETGKYR